MGFCDSDRASLATLRSGFKALIYQ